MRRVTKITDALNQVTGEEMGSLFDCAPPATSVQAEIESAPLTRNSNKPWRGAKSSNDPISLSHKSIVIPDPITPVRTVKLCSSDARSKSQPGHTLKRKGRVPA